MKLIKSLAYIVLFVPTVLLGGALGLLQVTGQWIEHVAEKLVAMFSTLLIWVKWD